jgi:filamentous hemagglutinin
MSRAHGDANSDAVTHTNSHINASNTVTIVSGGDTNIVGANVNANKVIGDIGGNLNLASVQDTSRSASRQSSAGGGFSISQGGGSASISVKNARASGSYAGVNEQAGIQAGSGGFDITVKGNTDLKGAYIASTATPDRNRLKTGTLSFSEIRNSSTYDASSVGISAGGSVGNGGNNYETHGPTTGKNRGGGLPGRVSESGSSQALTKSAISAGSITISDEANQKQDTAMLSRDVTNLNGIVDELPDLQHVLNNQSDMIDASQAAAETVARQVGAYADKTRNEALEAARTEADPEVKGQYLQEAEGWAEGGKNRVALHVAGGALTGGLSVGGLGAVGGAAGAGLSATLAPRFDEIARSIQDSGPTGISDVDELLGNMASNLLAGGGGALVGASAGALTSAATDLYNRQLHQREYDDAKRHAKTVAKELGISEQEAEGRIVAEILKNSDKQTAEASGGKHDYEVRRIVGCQNLNCDGYKNDPQYADHHHNSEYIEPNRVSYDFGQRRLGHGQTYNELVTSNFKQDPVGSTLAGVGMMGLGLATGGSLAPVGMMGIGTALALGVNGSVQLTSDKPFDWASFGAAGVTGALSTGMRFTPVLFTNVGGALTSSALNGENPNGAMGGAAVGTVVGYPIGSKVKGRLHDVLNPWYRQEWVDVGMGVSKYVPPSTLPSWSGGAVGGIAQENVGAAMQNKIDGTAKK